jgi:hypothetical protein
MVYTGDFLGPEEMNKNCRKMMHTGTMVRCFTALLGYINIIYALDINFKWFISLEELLSSVYLTPEHPVITVSHNSYS